MKLEKILTVLAAFACAMTAVAVSAFAAVDESVPDTDTSESVSDAETSTDDSVDESTDDSDNDDLVDGGTPVYIYTWSVPAAENQESGWMTENVKMTDLIGSVKPEDIDYIVIKGANETDEVGAGFNTTLTDTKAEGYYQSTEDDESWPTNGITVKGSSVDWNNYFLQLFSNRGDATTVTAAIYTKANADNGNNGAADDGTSSEIIAPTESSTSSESSSLPENIIPTESSTSTESSVPFEISISSNSTSSSVSSTLASDSNTANNGSASGANPTTGIAMTFIPAVIAGAVIIAAKRRK